LLLDPGQIAAFRPRHRQRSSWSEIPREAELKNEILSRPLSREPAKLRSSPDTFAESIRLSEDSNTFRKSRGLTGRDNLAIPEAFNGQKSAMQFLT
jgi:hypothetical protein